NTIIFKDAISTRMACRDNTKSDLYRETITENSFSFLVKNNRLVLSDSEGERLRFKKID
ncbi:MAG: META domain-containing protein, partial [Bacteroidales bacterium]|nr:META domain-containing protein [Bacteroidales bacterium]